VNTSRLVLAPGVQSDIVDHAREGTARTPPVEVCGVLAGARGATGDRVTDVRRVANVADDPTTRYELDPAATLTAIEEVTDAGTEVVGFYHSHPTGPAGPSPVDRELATWPGYVYLVVSLAGAEPVLSAWRWTGERFKRLSVEREASSGSKHETSPDEP
jgi:proteasome lid subunit RPN8/RPN11